jgi:hypothetical protein
MFGALVPDGPKVWAFKLVGPAELVVPHKAEFAELVNSVNFGGATAPTGRAAAADPTPAAQPTPPSTPPAAGEAAKIPGIASFTLPAGWQVDTKQRPMRLATIVVGAGDERAEVIVSRFPAAALADLKANLTRWRGLVNLPPTDDPAANPPQEIAFAQGPGALRDFVGPESDGPARKRQLVAISQFPKADQVWFFRLIGPHDLVAKNKPAFDAFVKSVKFDDSK